MSDDDDENDVDIEECKYTASGNCEDCSLPQGEDCPYIADDDVFNYGK